MNLVQQFFTATTMFVSLNIAFGVLLHDTNMDKAFLSSWKIQNVHGNSESETKMPETKPHTHPEHAQLSNVLKEGSARPRTTPRNNDKKRLRQKYAARGQHVFDGYHLDLEGIS
ncbi:hypothetical protein [Candidatus Nanosynbacter sp. HMT-352]|jgi:hypothetical protein|uniref:hypothetical protein n=1 Tax=Candidatus Nanosynbacter sp. HMT-352 TaxID=2899133 RepID=UPI001E4EBC46|nr:hypothetical protein [Candidatus Nanosynbacter sp. HMT-352]UHA57357.1 hypothetical protein LR957_03515 [Candidatus Nanosynbacter sp. HMT-352]